MVEPRPPRPTAPTPQHPQACSLGAARIGERRQLKRALEAFWAGKADAAHLQAEAAAVRQRNWAVAQAARLDQVAVGDFALYDHVLDTAMVVGATPAPYGPPGDHLDAMFAMARGRPQGGGGAELQALEMTKWFDTNYHYIVPQLDASTRFHLAWNKPLALYREACAWGPAAAARPQLLGPVSFLLAAQRQAPRWDLLDALLPVYAELLASLAAAGAPWVQLDEPCLVQDLDAAAQAALARSYAALAAGAAPKVMLASYFDAVGDNLPTALALPVGGLHLDMTRGGQALAPVLTGLRGDCVLSLGVVDGRNVWRADLDAALATLRQAADALGAERLQVAPSCSLLHVPADLDLEGELDAELRGWLAFGRQKLHEVRALADAVRLGPEHDAVAPAFAASRAARRSRAASPRIHRAAVQGRLADVVPGMLARRAPFAARRAAQQAALALPALPTTTIGSFPQTAEVRAARAAHRAGRTSAVQYQDFLRAQTAMALRFQEEVGLDVLVHGEFERNDMVEYFGEQLAGYAFTQAGWVQSYGSRAVKPPIVFGDVARPAPMTVGWTTYAQGLTKRPVKGMLTGPVTMLQWSFVRDDQPRAATCQQLALAIRDEVHDLEAAGIRVIQVDEPALREGLPLRRSAAPGYLRWAVDCFRLATAGCADATQVHTHMCYADFDDIIAHIAALDADVVSIESSRSRMALLHTFATAGYPNDVGPGIYDIHSPRVPDAAELTALLRAALAVVPAARLWVNPDCGLKTRTWEQVKPALSALVAAAATLRGGAAAARG